MCHEDFMRKNADEAWEFLESLSEKTMQWEHCDDRVSSVPHSKSSGLSLQSNIASEAKMIIMSHVPRGRSPTASADGVLPSYAVEYPSRAFSSHVVDGRHDEYYSTSDDFSPILLTLQIVPGTSTEVAQVVKEGGHRALRQLITDAPFVKDASSVQSLRKTDFLFGDSVRDPDAVFIDAEQWLHKNGGCDTGDVVALGGGA
ncbi:uncharacterized protein A4U43_C02F17050 [Asparagus officinalis]|uniref:Uncharacterized protein n=1 Tax=Asparagus officinalis TaxID=4686 RepID=A0A5P1FJ28_ASPOF|nr:uncharacterized protein A4U43_C02F17050 [Asparagus officinalis]